ncbi:FG-GAP repeat protein [Streptomyces amakusaensis]|uniref:FG-GAP and VCBS repeat-containing protein n=1 Tax=Streptomyces amakusaensis TaxID=67271 RepID=A0ABW0AMV9_9ACTN
MIMRKNLGLAVATATAAALTGGLLGLSAGTAAAAPAKHVDDFNGDGFRDYVTAERYASVTVTYGTATGLGKKNTFDQNSPGIPGATAGDDLFGEVTATADFNSDGYADLAVSDPIEKVGKHKARGLVVIVWGSKAGLGSKATTLAVKSPSEQQAFGRSLAAGDFDGNGKPDLAVADGRSVHIYRGGFSSKNGGTGKVTHHKPNSDALLEAHELVAGKVTKDRATDLYVLGSGYLDSEVASTWFLRGGSTIKAGKPTTYNTANPNYHATGVVADFDKDGHGDLAVGEPSYKNYAGAVLMVRGSASGPGSSYRLTQDTAGVATKMTKDDAFGYTVSAGDTNRDGYPDLAVGTMEKIGSAEGAGGAHILRGGKKGLTGTGSQWFTRATPGVPGDPRAIETFGAELRLRDLDRDGDADLLLSTGYHEKSLLLKGGPTGIVTKGFTEPNLRPNFPQ